MNLGSGNDYKMGCLNVDVSEQGHPDMVLDLAQEITFPLTARTVNGAQVLLEKNSLDVITANNLLEDVGDLPCLMTNLLSLLKVNGRLELEMNDLQKNPSIYKRLDHPFNASEIFSHYTELFWQVGWFDHRFEIENIQRIENMALKNIQNKSTSIKVSLRKIETTVQEKTAARVMMPDFKYMPFDLN
jgi:hypothetical protein